jgi:rare lipoprotein A
MGEGEERLSTLPLRALQIGAAACGALFAMADAFGRGPAQAIETGKATYYAARFEGRTTASGEVFRHSELTAAHPRLPFGTLVRLTRRGKGQSVIVRITDRGPAPIEQRRGTIIDVSKRAAAELGMMRAGRVPVRLEVLEWGAGPRAPAAPNERRSMQPDASPRTSS